MVNDIARADSKKPAAVPSPPSLSNSKTNGKARLYILDDHPTLVYGVSALIEAQPHLSIVGSNPDWALALVDIARLQPDVVLLDMNLGATNGITVLKNLRLTFPLIKVLVLSMHDEALYALRVLKMGASGYMMKGAATQTLVQAIDQILAGEIYLSERMQNRVKMQVLSKGRPFKGSPLEDLSDRELEVFRLMGNGLSTRLMADNLHISVKTIETHRAHIMRKMNLQNSAELVLHAIHWRI